MENGGVADFEFPNSQTRRGRVQDCGRICPAITTAGGVFRITELSNNPNDYEIRAITPRESFMIQGMTMEDCDKASAVGISNSQLYKQAGNGLTSNVVSLLFEHIYKAFYDENYVCLDEKMVADGYGIGDDCPYGEEEDGQLTLWGLMDDDRRSQT